MDPSSVVDWVANITNILRFLLGTLEDCRLEDRKENVRMALRCIFVRWKMMQLYRELFLLRASVLTVALLPPSVSSTRELNSFWENDKSPKLNLVKNSSDLSSGMYCRDLNQWKCLNISILYRWIFVSCNLGIYTVITNDVSNYINLLELYFLPSPSWLRG
jgi:hypothetical protein